MRSASRMRSASGLRAASAAMRFSSSLARLCTQTIPTTIRKGASTAAVPASNIESIPLQAASAQALDLGREARVAGHVVGLDLGQPAIDVAKPGAELARGALGRLANALPVPLLVPVDVEVVGLLRRQQAEGEVDRDAEAGRDGQDDEGQPPPDRVDPGVVLEPRADAQIGRASCRERVALLCVISPTGTKPTNSCWM